MFDWPELSLSLEGPAWIVLLVPGIFLGGFQLYRRTYPVLLGSERLGLTLLRTGAMGLMLLMLAEPILAVWKTTVKRPRLLVLVDISPSMVVDHRLERLAQAMGHGHFRERLANIDVHTWGFADTLYPVSIDTLAGITTRGRATDVGAALRLALERLDDGERIDGILLASDGSHNLGSDPRHAEFGVPLYILGYDGAGTLTDIQVVPTTGEVNGYVGKPMAITTRVRQWGFGSKEIEVYLFENEKQIARQRLVLAEEGREQLVEFSVVPDMPGPHIYHMLIPQEQGEVSSDNNETLVLAQVARQRISVLMISGGPSADLSFLRRILEAREQIDLKVGLQRPGGLFFPHGAPLPALLDATEVIVLLDPGEEILAGALAEDLVGRVRMGAGLLFIGGSHAFDNWNLKGPVAQILPLVAEAGGSVMVPHAASLRLGVDGPNHPVTQLPPESADPWALLPPLSGWVPSAAVRAQGKSLVEEKTGGPVVAAGTYGRGKVIAAWGSGFWRLDLVSSGVGGNPHTIRDFWRGAAEWLATPVPTGRLSVSTLNHIFRAGERVIFVARLFDGLLKPQSGATVEIKTEEVLLHLEDVGGGFYRGSMPGPSSGDHEYTARARFRGRPIGSTEGSFVVETYELESVDVRADPQMLEDLALESGGVFRTLDRWRELVEVLPQEQRLVGETRTAAYWGQNWSLVATVGLLSLEWGWRRRRGLI